jgi:glyoxylase-like metal-dependent hydrolase (beta-lactamase superfamily II)
MRHLLCSLCVCAGWIAAVWPASAPLLAQTPSPQAVSDHEAAARAARASAPDDGLDVVHVQGHVFMISGDGGNIAVQAGPDGAVLVDSGAGARSAAVVAAVRQLTDEPIRFIFNTIGHPDHAGGNAAVAAAGRELGGGGGGRGVNLAVVSGVRSGAQRIAHESVLLAMAKPGADGKPPFEEAAWPTEGFIERKQMYLNAEPIEAIHIPAATSEGSAIVFFRRSDVIATGPVVDTEGFPRFDAQSGGSINGTIAALNRLMQMAIPPTPLVYQRGGTQLVTGRGRVMEQTDLAAYRDMVTVIRDRVRDQVRRGVALPQILASQPAQGYVRRYGSTTGQWTTETFLRAVHASLVKEERP